MNRRFVRFFRFFRKLAALVRQPQWSSRHPLGSKGALQPSAPNPLNPEQFQSELTALETAIRQLRQHFDEIHHIQQQQQTLRQRLTTPTLPEAELLAIHQQLETLETELVSATLPWQTLAEPFWQAVRFGGLGLVAGWFLKGLVQGQ
ncbi:MAG: hypothetical protein ACFB0C_18955 [Leptolyngbyaceae cyanobacterium]